MSSAGGAAGLSAADLAIADAALASIAEEMGEALGRSAYSPNIKERRDYSCAVFDAAGQMVAQAAHIPVHLGAMPASVRAVLHLAPFAAGDVFALNDPSSAGRTCPTSRPSPRSSRRTPRTSSGLSPPAPTMPTSAGSPRVRCLSPASCCRKGSSSLPLRLVRAGTPEDSTIALIVRNSRAPDERRGDLRAQLAATSLGALRLQAAAARFGLAGLRERFEALLAHGERVVRAVIAQIPTAATPSRTASRSARRASRSASPSPSRATRSSSTSAAATPRARTPR